VTLLLFLESVPQGRRRLGFLPLVRGPRLQWALPFGREGRWRFLLVEQGKLFGHRPEVSRGIDERLDSDSLTEQ
jgi:hypothetical protein